MMGRTATATLRYKSMEDLINRLQQINEVANLIAAARCEIAQGDMDRERMKVPS